MLVGSSKWLSSWSSPSAIHLLNRFIQTLIHSGLKPMRCFASESLNHSLSRLVHIHWFTREQNTSMVCFLEMHWLCLELKQIWWSKITKTKLWQTWKFLYIICLLRCCIKRMSGDSGDIAIIVFRRHSNHYLIWISLISSGNFGIIKNGLVFNDAISVLCNLLVCIHVHAAGNLHLVFALIEVSEGVYMRSVPDTCNRCLLLLAPASQRFAVSYGN